MLTKAIERVFVPAVPEVPASPGGNYCYTPPASGYWEQSVQTLTLYPDSGIQVPSGQNVISVVPVYKPDGTVEKFIVTLWVSTWIQEGPNADPVCTYYAPQEYVQGSAARIEQRIGLGWDAGANSLQSQPGDCEAVWEMAMVVGAYIGLTASLEEVTSTDRFTHAFYFHQSAGRMLYKIKDGGVAVSNDTEYATGTEFKIRRVAGVVTYWVGGALIHTSSIASIGEVHVGTALYASGDAVPSGSIQETAGGLRFTGSVPPDYTSDPFTLPAGNYVATESADGASCDWAIGEVDAEYPLAEGIEGSSEEFSLESEQSMVLVVFAYEGGGPFDIMITENV